MWKKLPLYNRPRDDTVGSPVLIDSTIDEKTLHEIPSISDLNSSQFSSYSLSARPAFGRRSTDDVMRGSPGLPELPFKSLEPPVQHPDRPISDIPTTTSSIYSQPTPDLRQNGFSRFDFTTSPLPDNDVSPPSSPETIYPEENYRRQSDGWRGSPSVSPVEELPEISETESEHRYEPASIARPVENTQSTQRKKPGWGFFSTWDGKRGDESPRDRDSTITRWDDFSGEPTTDGSGSAPRIDPRNPPFFDETIEQRPEPNDRRVESHTPIDFGLQGSAKPTSAEQTLEPRHDSITSSTGTAKEWNDLNGRGATSSPITDKPLPATKPLIIPRRSSKRAVPTVETASDTSAPSSVFLRSDASIISSTASDDASSTRPLVPLKAGRNSPPRAAVSPVPYYYTDMQSPSPLQYGATYNGVGSASIDRYRDKPLPIPKDDILVVKKNRRSAGTIETNFRSAMNEMQFQEEQPVSRFSATTYDTETTYDSRPGSPALSASNFTPTPASSILNRRRPVPGVTNVRATTRKPTPSQLSTTSSDPNRKSKSLPQSPPELESVDLITSLQAQLDNMHHQRGNIQRLLRDLSQLNLTTQGTASRAEVKRKADKFQLELSEIMRAEHDIGLRLHRAWRRKDQQGEPTGLWVRRVTG